jgi:ubiquinone biosynthesis protein
MSLRRSIKILTTVARHRLDLLLPDTAHPFLLKCLLFPCSLWSTNNKTHGVRLREALEELGPIYVKFGQLLSTRRDLLPDDIADELCKLQDRVPPFSSDLAIAIIEKSLNKPIDQLFHQFNPVPLASASVAQVHAATLKSGEEVVVKVVRPNLRPIIEEDLAVLEKIAQLVERFHPDGKRLHPVEVVRDYRYIIIDELDLQREAANTAQLRRNFENSEKLYVPKIYWDYTNPNVMVSERIYGIPVTNIEELKAANIDLKTLAERGVEIFFTQLFRDNFFHADMHPGNVFVSYSNPKSPQYIGIDCAIIGSLSESDQYYIARNLLAIFHRNYREVAALHVECGWIPPDTRIADFEAAIRSACEPIIQKPLGEISFATLLIYLFQTARRFNMQVQPSLVLLQKTLINIEGLGRQLYPQLDLWSTAKPFLEKWVAERYSIRGLYKRLKPHLPSLWEALPTLPDRFANALDQQQQLTDLAKRQQYLMELIHTAQQRHFRERKLWLALAAAVLVCVIAIDI